jgi:diguanylate cyclase (GGDEF)-like protein
MIDLDRFKSYNDSFGHAAGDVALRAAARTISSTMRREDVVTRYGGEEFVAILPGVDLGTARGARKRSVTPWPKSSCSTPRPSSRR